MFQVIESATLLKSCKCLYCLAEVGRGCWFGLVDVALSAGGNSAEFFYFLCGRCDSKAEYNWSPKNFLQKELMHNRWHGNRVLMLHVSEGAAPAPAQTAIRMV